MATVNITNRYGNERKRTAEVLVASLPSQLEEGGGRLSTPAVITQFADDHVVSTIGPNTIVKKAYLIVDTAYAALSTATVTIGGTTVFNGVAVTATGISASATEDVYFDAAADITITLGGNTGDASGDLRVVLDIDSLDLSNGNYAASV